jgi:hypothetical protein
MGVTRCGGLGNLIRVSCIPFVEPNSESLALGTLAWTAGSLVHIEVSALPLPSSDTLLIRYRRSEIRGAFRSPCERLFPLLLSALVSLEQPAVNLQAVGLHSPLASLSQGHPHDDNEVLPQRCLALIIEAMS